jgi:hypothetical protein
MTRFFIRGALSADSSTRRHSGGDTATERVTRVQHDIVRIDNVARIFCAIARCQQLIVATSGRKSSVYKAPGAQSRLRHAPCTPSQSSHSHQNANLVDDRQLRTWKRRDMSPTLQSAT